MIRYVDAASSTGGPDRGLSDFFAALARQICNLSAAYRSAYQLKDGTFGPSQTANVMALYLNLMDNVTKPIVASALVSSHAKHGNRTQSVPCSPSWAHRLHSR
jgi:hypothetical protein